MFEKSKKKSNPNYFVLQLILVRTDLSVRSIYHKNEKIGVLIDKDTVGMIYCFGEVNQFHSGHHYHPYASSFIILYT